MRKARADSRGGHFYHGCEAFPSRLVIEWVLAHDEDEVLSGFQTGSIRKVGTESWPAQYSVGYCQRRIVTVAVGQQRTVNDALAIFGRSVQPNLQASVPSNHL